MTNEPMPLGMIIERNVETPMRDGVILRSDVFRPATPGRYPALVQRTPYGRATGGFEAFVRAGFAVISQDSRGRYGSDGDFTVFSEPNTGDAEDGFDTVEWAATQPWCNGRVGVMGLSYNAWMAWQLAKLQPPHLQAMAAMSVPVELTDLDYTGSFRLARRLHWWLVTMAPDLRRRAGWGPPHAPSEAKPIWHDLEHGRRLHHLPVIDIVRHLPPPLAEQADRWLRDPASRPWQLDQAHHHITVPNLDVSGWFDHCNGSIRHLAGMQRNGGSERARQHSRLIIGPWNHVGLGQSKQGNTDFGPAAQMDRNALVIQWFSHWLQDVDNGVDRWPAVQYFVLGADEWRGAQAWPHVKIKSPDDARDVLHLGPAEALQVPPPDTDHPPDRFTYDPADPLPTVWSPTLFTEPVDRRQLDHRGDLIRYRTAPLRQDVEIIGEPQLVLFASSSAPDTDFFAWIADEAPDGRAMQLTGGMVRAKHRRGIEHNDPIVPGQIIEYLIRMNPVACRLRAGHRLRLDISSSDFPNHDRNHNTGGDDLLDARLEIAEQAVHFGRAHPSRLLLPGNERPEGQAWD